MDSAHLFTGTTYLGTALLALGFSALVSGTAVAATTVVTPAPAATAPAPTNAGAQAGAQESFVGETQAQQACAAGTVEACHWLAQNYLGQQQYAQAAQYLSKVCYSNSEQAYQSCAALSTLLTDSHFGLNDYPQGIKVGQYLCDHGQSYGCLILSSLYYIGDHVEQNLKTAADYGKRACALKDATGCRQAALAIFSEAYMKRDVELFKESGQYHQAACDLGDQESCTELREYQTKLEQFNLYVQNGQKPAPPTADAAH